METGEAQGTETSPGAGDGLKRPGGKAEAPERPGGKAQGPAAGDAPPSRAPERIDGYAPIRDYAPIGDGRTLALVALDGSIDWLCLPTFPDGSVFAAMLDPARGGRFALAPEAPFEATRRYLPETNVLETTFTTAEGTVRVTDAMSLQDGALLPWAEVVRQVEGLSGEVAMRWRVEPRFDYARAQTTIERRRGVPVASAGADAVALHCWDAGEPEVTSEAISGEFTARDGEQALLALCGFHDAPLMTPRRADIESRLRSTAEVWRRFSAQCSYDGPWRDAVVRSALALKLLAYAPSGAITAAPTTSLPEALGGIRNFDYRYVWVRDSTFTMDALLRLGYRADAHQSLVWLLHASGHTHPRMQPIYRLEGPPLASQTTLPLAGYRDSRPVHLGNGAGSQLQLSNYGDLLETAELYVRHGGVLDPHAGRRLAEVIDLLCELWPNPDAGLWELGDYQHYTESKMGCWTAIDRALTLAEQGQVPTAHVERWRREAAAIRDFVDARCWSEEKRAYARSAGQHDQLDAAVLLIARMGFIDPHDERMASTIDAIRRELAHDGGPPLYRYSGMEPKEGAFLACSFWMVEALARSGRLDEAGETMEAAVAVANDVGLLSEEIDPESRELLGNFPQGLSHLALVNAAALIARAEEG